MKTRAFSSPARNRRKNAGKQAIGKKGGKGSGNARQDWFWIYYLDRKDRNFVLTDWAY